MIGPGYDDLYGDNGDDILKGSSGGDRINGGEPWYILFLISLKNPLFYVYCDR